MMSPKLRTTLMLVAVAGVLLLAGCAKKATQQPPTPAPAPPAPSSTPAPTPGTPAPATPAPSSAPSPSATISDLQPVFFDYDSDALRDDSRGALDRNARVLRDNSSLKIVIEGHCDERGTAEYNQALGERRANAARDYLASAGIAAARMRVISYGKERPFSDGHDESAWAQNRRAHFVSQ